MIVAFALGAVVGILGLSLLVGGTAYSVSVLRDWWKAQQ